MFNVYQHVQIDKTCKISFLVITCKERAKERIRYPKHSYNWSYDNNLKLKRRVDRFDGLISVTYDIDTQICFVSGYRVSINICNFINTE